MAAYWKSSWTAKPDGQESRMDRFLSGKYERYLRILADPSDELQRKIGVKLLAEEEATRREGALNKEEPP